MEPLRARINFAEKTVQFSGPGTFAAKEQIKSLGAARWNSQLKCWDVRMVNISLDELKSRFPQANFDVGDGVEVPAESELSTAITSAADSMLPASVGVAELLGQLRAVLQEAFPLKIYLRGVVSKVKRHDSWIYLDLIDEQQRDTKLECIIRSADGNVEAGLIKAGFKLEENLQVMCGVQVGMRAKAGVVSLRIVEFVPEYTLGKLAAERDKTNERLKKEGLFERNRQLTLAFLPRRLGILTSAKGTVIHDFLASLNEARFGFELFLCHATVQGDEARESIIAGIDRLQAIGVDAIVLMRGGGSPAELAIFNDYEIARRVCISTVPIVSAIGHQEDQSSVQDVSFRACGVPKDVGRFFADIVLLLRTTFAEKIERTHLESVRLLERAQNEVRSLQQLIIERTQNLINLTAQRLDTCRDLVPRDMARRLSEGRKEMRRIAEQLRSAAEALVIRWEIQLKPYFLLPRSAMTVIERADERVSSQAQLVEAASPQTQLARGFAIVHAKSEQRIVTRGSDLAVAEQVEIEFADRRVNASVQKIGE